MVVKANGSQPTVANGSLRSYARHRGCSSRAVQKARAAGRLNKSVVLVDGRPRIVDFALADAEWDANTGRVHVSTKAADEDADDQAYSRGDVTSLEVVLDQLSVSTCGSTIVLACLRPDGDQPDIDDSFVIPMSVRTAWTLASKLLEMAALVETGVRNQ